MQFNDNMEVSKDNLIINEIIGEGAFGYVRKGKLLPSGQVVAIKMLKGYYKIDCKNYDQ